MNKIALTFALVLSTLTVGCGASGFQHSHTPVTLGSQESTPVASMEEVCSQATIRQRLGNHGVTVDGVTYFCGTSAY